MGFQDFGELNVSVEDTSTKAGADAIQLSVIGGMPVSENAGVYAEIGFNLWDADVSLSRPGFGSASKVKMEAIFFMASALIFH